MEKTYVTHTCKNSRLKETDPNYCFNTFIDIDLYDAQSTPPTHKYCPECEAKGFIKKKKTIDPELKQKIKEGRQKYWIDKKQKTAS